MTPTASQHPNREKLELLVNRAKKRLPQQGAGFVNCYIVTDDPPVLAYDFKGPMEADQYLISMEATSSGFRKDDSNPSRVLQTVQMDRITF